MENDNWNNRNRRGDYRYGDRDIDQNRRSDEDSYRGAYRLDNNSDHRNVSTYNGFDAYNRQRGNENPRGDQQQGGDYVYRRSRNQEDNNQHNQDYTRGREQQQYRQDDRHQQDYYNRHNGSRHHTTTFNDDYAPDNYRHRKGENYGNMAGSLSFGYDGDRNSDPDYNKRYDPLSGRIQNNSHNSGDRDNSNGQNQRRRYGAPDQYGINPDYDRY